MHEYKKTEESLWQGRNDTPPNEAYYQLVKCVDAYTYDYTQSQSSVALIGFCSDEGIRRNEGRIGAKLGPITIRKQLARLSIHKKQQMIDLGDIHCIKNNLEASQQSFANLISQCHANKIRSIAFGGGHEIAWAHFQGLIPHYKKLGIINFDAHFDIRMNTTSESTSGTPFAQVHQYCQQNNTPFHYCCLGIQNSANSPTLLQRAKDWGVSFLTAEQMYETSTHYQLKFIEKFISNLDAIYLTICMDVFSESYAPGVSAPQPLGLSPWQCIPLLKYLTQSGKVVSIDVAELSPPLDENEKTSRLSARLLAEII